MSKKAFLPVLAAFLLVLSGTLHAQDLDRSVSLRIRNGTVEDFLKSVTKETGVLFSYAPSVLPSGNNIQVAVRNRPLRQVLDEVLSPVGIRWKIIENQIVLTKSTSEHKASANPLVPAGKERFRLAGFVRDKANGEPLIGAHIRVEGTSAGTVANAFGYFSLSVLPGACRYTVTFLGFTPVTGEADPVRDTMLLVEMEESHPGLP